LYWAVTPPRNHCGVFCTLIFTLSSYPYHFWFHDQERRNPFYLLLATISQILIWISNHHYFISGLPTSPAPTLAAATCWFSWQWTSSLEHYLEGRGSAYFIPLWH
jgi:hypothetical protein